MKYGSRAGSMRNAGSPIIRAASADRSIASRSGGWRISAGKTPYLRSRITRASSTDVRELESAASVRISAAGRDEIIRMLRTGPWHAIPVPGITSSLSRVSSNEGTIPISAAPDASWSAQPEGRRNSRSNSPRCGP